MQWLGRLWKYYQTDAVFIEIQKLVLLNGEQDTIFIEDAWWMMDYLSILILINVVKEGGSKDTKLSTLLRAKLI